MSLLGSGYEDQGAEFLHGIVVNVELAERLQPNLEASDGWPCCNFRIAKTAPGQPLTSLKS